MDTKKAVIVLNPGQSGNRSIEFLNLLDGYVIKNDHIHVSQVTESYI